MRRHDLGQWVTEDYVAAVATLESDGRTVIGARLAEFFGVTPPTVTDIIHRLEKAGYLAIGENKTIGLTDTGRALARQTLRRRRLAERFFVDALGLTMADAQNEADRLEHALSDEVTERLSHALGDPDSCPHGEPIVVPTATPSHLSTTLDRAPVGIDLVLERVSLEARGDRELPQELAELGLVPGARVAIEGVSGEDLAIRTAYGVSPLSRRAAGALVVREAQSVNRSSESEKLEPQYHLTVTAVQGKCLAGHQEGDGFQFGHCAPAGLCLDALQRVIPALSALRLGDRSGAIQVPCPDDGIVTFMVERTVDAHAKDSRLDSGRARPTGARAASA